MKNNIFVKTYHIGGSVISCIAVLNDDGNTSYEVKGAGLDDKMRFYVTEKLKVDAAYYFSIDN